MKENSPKVLSFPSPVPAKADYQRVKAQYSVREIKQLFGLSERTIRRWTEQGIIHAAPTPEAKDYTYDFHALTQFRQSRQRGFKADITTPSSETLIASAGQTNAHVGSLQCIHTVGIVAVVSARSM